jgi:alpha-N-arabinofuranosidase
VEIGNEDHFDHSGSYEGRYAQFYKAIKAKYPELQLIATMPLKGMRPDVVDDHYYVRAQEFFRDQTHYDKADRTGPKIFVGEWATREGAPTPNFGAALGDAAWMTGLGAEQRPDGDGLVCAAADECESGRAAVGYRPDRL